MMGPNSTHGYNSIVVGFIFTINELLMSYCVLRCMRSVLHDVEG